MITSPHSGEKVPSEAGWLHGLDSQLLLTDVDRFVDELYRPACEVLDIPFVEMETSRYVLDLNRLPTDIDATSVVGATSDSESSFASGYHWTQTTLGHPLMKAPISRELHDEITRNYYDPFHRRVREAENHLIQKYGLPRYHIDAHSMPSQGKAVHKDAGQVRPDLVVSDCSGKSCAVGYKDEVIAAFTAQGFQVAYNWPYLGGRMTEQYGRPQENRHSVQIELNRRLYLNEVTKEKLPEFDQTRERIFRALESIHFFLNKGRNSS
jgi:N-formylglutamate deformylase